MKKLALFVALLSLTTLLVPFAFATEICGEVTICKDFTCGCGSAPTSGLLLNTPYTWYVQITVANGKDHAITDVVLADRFGAEFGVEIVGSGGGSGGTPPSLSTKGNSDKVFLEWNIGTIDAYQPAWIVLRVYTDINPAGHQEFTSCGTYYINSGAVVKWLDNGQKYSAETLPLAVSTA